MDGCAIQRGVIKHRSIGDRQKPSSIVGASKAKKSQARGVLVCLACVKINNVDLDDCISVADHTVTSNKARGFESGRPPIHIDCYTCFGRDNKNDSFRVELYFGSTSQSYAFQRFFSCQSRGSHNIGAPTEVDGTSHFATRSVLLSTRVFCISPVAMGDHRSWESVMQGLGDILREVTHPSIAVELQQLHRNCLRLPS